MGQEILPNATGDAENALKRDYQRMVDDGLLFEEAESFDQLMEECRGIQERVNKRYSTSKNGE
jgi:hypothetical protein